VVLGNGVGPELLPTQPLPQGQIGRFAVPKALADQPKSPLEAMTQNNFLGILEAGLSPVQNAMGTGKSLLWRNMLLVEANQRCCSLPRTG
jgi:hypothetical protein